MYTASSSAASCGITSWPRRAEAWLDDRGKGAWIAAMVLGFIAFWPVGLAILAYMIWSKRMFNRTACGARHVTPQYHRATPSSGNSAFDAYKAETLRRLEEEQGAFEAFLQRLREAKDKSEFDNFMADRAKTAHADMDDRNQAPQTGNY
ncbi:MAG: DUF2852 domain-containing protein [Pseudorhodobacter sp.]|nr:DUF2852 domain-containing protein [Pseudorhodobacter sp.]